MSSAPLFASDSKNMRLVILDDYDKASEWAAKYVRNRILQFNPTKEKPFVLGLPTGKLKLYVTSFRGGES